MDIALVHGNFHGAWCWELLIPELERLGHRAIAMDLPISDPDGGAAAYANAVGVAIAPMREPVLVGHSMGGLVIPLVAARRPVRRMIFLAAMLPVPGTSANDQRAREPVDPPVPPSTAEWTDMGEDVWAVGPNTATELFFHDATPDVAGWAIARLRPQHYGVMREPTPLAAWPKVPASSIVCADDHAFNPDWVRATARDRLGVEPLELPGGHSPFLTRPRELAVAIDALAAKP